MKSCPECRTEYFDETLNFCLEDGRVLTNGDARTELFGVPPQEHQKTEVLKSEPPKAGTPNSSIAVLPFVNMSADIEILAEFKQLSNSQHVSPTNIAKVYVGLGEDGKALKQLELACEEKAVRLAWVMVDPSFKRFHGDARYNEVGRRFGLPEIN